MANRRATSSRSTGLVSVFAFLAGGATIGAIGHLTGVEGLMTLAGWLFFIGSVCGWYTASAMMLEEAFDREVLPLGSVETVHPAPAGVTARTPQRRAARRARR